jgi:hypothetical protein
LNGVTASTARLFVDYQYNGTTAFDAGLVAFSTGARQYRVVFREDLNPGITSMTFNVQRTLTAPVGGGSVNPFVVDLNSGNLGMGASSAMPAGSTGGFVFLPRVAVAPTVLPDATNMASRDPWASEAGNRRLWGTNGTVLGWHFVCLDDYNPTPTRIPFGAATAQTQTDDAAFFYSVGTGVLRSPLVETNTVGGFGGGNVLTLENNHASPTTSLSLLSGTTTLTGGFTWTNATGIARSPLVETNTVGGFGGGGVLTLENNHASPVTSISLGGANIQTFGDFNPVVTTSFNLGSTAKNWAVLHIGQINGGSSPNISMFCSNDAIGVDSTTTGVWSVTHGGLGGPRFKSDITGIAFFNGATAAQQTGGAATAGLVYSATEQLMLQTAYNCLRTFALLS